MNILFILVIFLIFNIELSIGVDTPTAAVTNEIDEINEELEVNNNNSNNSTDKFTEYNKTGLHENEAEPVIEVEEEEEDEKEKEREEKRKKEIENGIEEYVRPIKSQYKSIYTNSFSVSIHCLYGREKQCDIFIKKIKSAVESIDKIIEINNEIRISIFLLDLTDICGDCLNIVIPPNYAFLKEGNSEEIYSYPQALVKQLDVKNIEKFIYDFANVDINIVLNVAQDDEDIKALGEFAVTREILHGMGIMTTGGLVNSIKNQIFPEDFYAPNRAYQIDLDNKDVNGVYISYEHFFPLSVYEKNIVTQANPNNYIFSDLVDMFKIEYEPQLNINYMLTKDDIEKENTSIRQAYTDFVSSPYFEKAKLIAQLYKQKGSVGFKATDGTVIPLQTFDGEYYKTLSINHIDIPNVRNAAFYSYDPFNKNEINKYLNEDFIMNYTYMFGYDAEQIAKIVANDKKKSIGPGVKKILQTIGWTIKDDNNNRPKSTYRIAEEVFINNDNTLNDLLRYIDKHNYLLDSNSNQLVCDIRAYAITLLVASAFLAV